MFRILFVFLVVGTWLGTSACQEVCKPEVLASPGTTMEMGHFFGTPLSGPTKNTGGAIDAKDCVAVRVTWLVMAKMPESGLGSLGAQVRLIVAERSRQPVLPTMRLTLNARMGPAAEVMKSAGSKLTVGDETAALPPGVTLSCHLSDPVKVVDPATGSPTERYVRVEAYRPGGAAGAKGIALAVTVQDWIAPSAGGEDFVVSGAAEPSRKQKASAPELQRETALLDAAELDKPVAIAVPFVLAGTQTQVVVVVVALDPSPPAQQLTKDVATATADLAKGDAQAEALPAVNSSWSAITAAIGSLGRAEQRRPALVFLANETQASLLADTALVADEAALGQLVDHIKALAGATADPAALGWTLDRTTFDFLCELQSQPKMPGELEGVLAVHAGEAARHGSSLDEIRGGLTTRADFAARLVAENQIFLEDSSPAARIRAYDWLVRMGQAPPGYDPLGDPRERRAALDKYAQGPAATETAPSPTTTSTTAPAPASAPTGGGQ